MRQESRVWKKVSLSPRGCTARIYGFLDGRYCLGDGRDVDMNLLMLLGWLKCMEMEMPGEYLCSYLVTAEPHSEP